MITFTRLLVFGAFLWLLVPQSSAQISVIPDPFALSGLTTTKTSGGGTGCVPPSTSNVIIGDGAGGCTASSIDPATVVISTLTISTTSPLGGGGSLAANRTLTCTTCGVTGSPLSQFAATTSAQFAGVISDETGTSLVVLNTSPLLVTPKVTTITDANGNPFFISSATASAVDSLTVTNAATANPATVAITASGSDSNINLSIIPKGTGKLNLGSTNATVDTSGLISAVGGYASGATPPSLTVGTAAASAYAEGTVPSVCATSGVDCLYWDSTQHGPMLSRNNGSYLPVPQGPATSTSNGLASWNSTNGGLLASNANWTLTTTTLTAGASAVLDASAAATSAFKVPGGYTTGVLHNTTTTGAVVGGLIVNADITNSTIDLTAKVTGTLPVANGGTGLTSGTSGGVLAYTASGTLASSGALTANLPVIGGGAGAAPTVGSRTGNTTQFASWTGATTAGRCVDTDANGNLQTTASDCGTGGSASAGAPLVVQTASTSAITVTGPTTLIGTTGFGSLTIPANWFSVAGTVLQVCETNLITTGAVPGTVQFKLNFGATTVGQTAAFTPLVSLTNATVSLCASLTARTVGASGTIFVNDILPMTGATLTPGEAAFTNPTPGTAVTIDTTATQVLDFTVTFQLGATNSIVGTGFQAASPGSAISSIQGLTGAVTLFNTNAKTATYQALASDFSQCKTIPVASGTFTITLVASGAQPADGQCIEVINYGSGVVTIARSGQNINGGTASFVLESSSALGPSRARVVSNGTDYFIGSGFTNPMTTANDIIIAATTGLPTRTACATANTVLKGGAPAACAALVALDLPATPVITPGTAPTLVGPRGYAVCTGTCTVSVPVPVAGYEFCIYNDDNIATAITLSALGSSAMYENSARTAYGTAGTGTLVVAAAAANKVCLLGRDSTHYFTVSNGGGAITVN